MNHSQKTIIGFILTLSVVLAAPPAQAESKVTLQPSSLTIVGTQCPVFFKCQPVKRNLLIRTNEALASLQVVPLDLNRGDSSAVISANAISLTLLSKTLQPKQAITLPIELNFESIPSGEYSGQMLVIYENGELSVPIIVRIKDNWLFPLLVLLLGVGLGIGVSAYRSDGIPRDEILIQVGRIRTEIQADLELVKSSFAEKILGYIKDVERYLAAKQWDSAQQAVNQAQLILDKWQKNRGDWVVLIKYLSELFDNLNDLNSDVSYMQDILGHSEDLRRQVVDIETTQKFREELNNLRQQVFWYEQSQAKLDQLNNLKNGLTLSKKEEHFRLISQGLQNDLDGLSPSNKEALYNWRDKVNDIIDKLEQEIKEQSLGETKGTQTTARDANYTKLPMLPNPAVPTVIAGQLNPTQAARNIYWFNWLNYTIAVLLLAGAGFGQLYANQPIFGANGWSDYFTLLAWGFGAETTRDAITKVVRDWKLPGLK